MQLVLVLVRLVSGPDPAAPAPAAPHASLPSFHVLSSTSCSRSRVRRTPICRASSPRCVRRRLQLQRQSTRPRCPGSFFSRGCGTHHATSKRHAWRTCQARWRGMKVEEMHEARANGERGGRDEGVQAVATARGGTRGCTCWAPRHVISWCDTFP